MLIKFLKGLGFSFIFTLVLETEDDYVFQMNP